jgi:uncharacterized ferritin-like protein (DUF455 family)
LVAPGKHGEAPRAVTSREGIGDRLRAAAFAELQAREAFRWGAARFEEAPEALRKAWEGLGWAEDRHLGWLLKRMEELEIPIDERGVSDQLWHSLVSCSNARDFAQYMASAEERGRRAGERFRDAMAQVDPVSAKIFGAIAEEEVEHIRLAERFYPSRGTLPPESSEKNSRIEA